MRNVKTRKFDQEGLEKLILLYESGCRIKDIAEYFQVDTTSVWRQLKTLKLKTLIKQPKIIKPDETINNKLPIRKIPIRTEEKIELFRMILNSYGYDIVKLEEV